MSLALFGMISPGEFFGATVGTAPWTAMTAVVSISIYVTGRRRLRRGRRMISRHAPLRPLHVGAERSRACGSGGLGLLQRRLL